MDLIDLGVTNFGENKDQEAAPKALEVANALQAKGAEIAHKWHFVGQLQSNKVKSVLRYASAIHSLDRPSLLSALDKETQKLNAARLEAGESPATPIDVFIELNLTGDPERGGIEPTQVTQFAEQVLLVAGVNLQGVMGVASVASPTDPLVAERDFETILRASDAVKRLKPEAKYMSAGMSGDFETALQFGATHLRIGTAITGQRSY
jgi:uncharacterized pyridoxal phosphate-containing UPF0001 family protein